MNHNAPKSMLNLTDSTGKLVWSLLHMSELEFDAAPRAGIKDKGAEALSFLRTIRTDQTQIKD